VLRVILDIDGPALKDVDLELDLVLADYVLSPDLLLRGIPTEFPMRYRSRKQIDGQPAITVSLVAKKI